MREQKSKNIGNTRGRGGGAPWKNRCFPEGTAACGEPIPEQRKKLRSKEQQRETTVY